MSQYLVVVPAKDIVLTIIRPVPRKNFTVRPPSKSNVCAQPLRLTSKWLRREEQTSRKDWIRPLAVVGPLQERANGVR